MRGVSVTQKFQLGELVLSTGKEANGPATVTSTFSNRHPGSHVEWSWSEKEDMATKESGAGFFGQRSASGRLVADSAQTRRVARLMMTALQARFFVELQQVGFILRSASYLASSASEA